jgi:hypothetical protein
MGAFARNGSYGGYQASIPIASGTVVIIQLVHTRSRVDYSALTNGTFLSSFHAPVSSYASFRHLSSTERLAFSGQSMPLEADALRFLIVENFDGVAVENGDDRTGKVCECWRC